MNRKEMLALEPDRELDELVATLLMRWRLNENGFWEGTNYSHYPPHPAWAMCDNKYFRPSRDIAIAWEVSSKFPEKHIVIEKVPPDGKTRICVGDFIGRFDSSAEAICKALLQELF